MLSHFVWFPQRSKKYLPSTRVWRSMLRWKDAVSGAQAFMIRCDQHEISRWSRSIWWCQFILHKQSGIWGGSAFQSHLIFVSGHQPCHNFSAGREHFSLFQLFRLICMYSHKIGSFIFKTWYPIFHQGFVHHIALLKGDAKFVRVAQALQVGWKNEKHLLLHYVKMAAQIR